VVVVCRTDDDGIDVFLLDALSPVRVGLGSRETLERIGKTGLLTSQSATTFSLLIES